MNVSIVGSGYVGLTTGLCLAKMGHNVVCVDKNEEKINAINEGNSPIYEVGIRQLLQEVLGSTFHATTDIESAVLGSTLTMIAVGTPFDGEKIDLSALQECASEIGLCLRDLERFHTVVLKSTVVPGTTLDLLVPILESCSGRLAGRDFGVGMNPEFLREGSAIDDFMNPDRIVIGAIDEYSAEIIRELYSDFSDSVIIKTNPHTAEMIKYTANSLLATFISFANEVANLCSVTPSVDVSEVMEAVVLDRRISLTLPDGRKVTPGMSSYLNAGCGFGGSCFPKDVRALIAHARQSKVEMQILDAVMRTNDTQPERMLNLLDKHIELNTGDKVTVLGLSFKPGTNDIRESPALIIINHLLGRGAAVTVYDPVALNDAAAKFEGKAIRYGTSLVDALRDARAVLLVTHWPEFEPISELISRMEPTPILIDGRRFIEPSSVPLYDGIGIGPAFSNLGVS